MQSITVKRTGEFQVLLFESSNKSELSKGAKVLSGKHALSKEVRFGSDPRSYDYEQGARYFAFVAMPISVFGLKKLKPSKYESDEVFRKWVENSLNPLMPDKCRLAPDRQKTSMLLIANDLKSCHVESYPKYWLAADDSMSKLYCAVTLIYTAT